MITTGDGDDIVIGGDGEIVTDAIISEHTAVGRTVAPDSSRGDGDVVSSPVMAATWSSVTTAASAPPGWTPRRFDGHLLTLGLVEMSIESLIGGFGRDLHARDGDDIVVGGIDADTIGARRGRQHRDRRQRPP